MENEITLDNLNLICEIHNSPIGGVCSDLFCVRNPLMCIICAMDNSSCIRQLNHELITFEEYFFKYEKLLNQKFPGKNLTIIQFFQMLKQINLEKIENDYLVRLNERENINNNSFEDLKFQIINEGFEKSHQMRNKYLKDIVYKIEEVEEILKKLKNNGFELFDIEENKLLYITDMICSKYSELANTKEILKCLFKIENKNFVSNECNKKDNDNQVVCTDYQFLLNTVGILKYLKNNSSDQVTDDKNKMLYSKTYIEFFNNKAENYRCLDIDRDKINININNNINTSTEPFDSVLTSLDVTIPTVMGKVLDEYSQLLYEQIISDNDIEFGSMNKFTEDEEFSYSNKALFNTSQKFKFNLSHPSLLKHSITITKFFKSFKNMDMALNLNMDTICLFNVKSGKEYLAYQGVDTSLYFINLSENEIKEDMPSIKFAYENIGEIFKFEHYRSVQEDFLFTLNMENIVIKYQYENETFSYKDKLKIDTLSRGFDIVEINYIPYLFIINKEKIIQQYEILNKFKLVKKFNTPISGNSYGIKSFYNIYLNKFFLVIQSTDFCVNVYDIESGLLHKTFKTTNSKGVIHSKFSLSILHVPDDKDYHIICLFHKDIEIFKFSNQKLVKFIKFSKNSFSIFEIWNTKYLVSGYENGEIFIFDLTKQKKVNDIKGHMYSVGVKRYNSKKIGEVLITYSLDGEIKMWTCSY